MTTQERIDASAPKVDKRKINGNNGTRRGADKKPRKRREGYYVLRPEVRAGLRERMEIVLAYLGGRPSVIARRLGVSVGTVQQWRIRGMISAEGARLVHRDYQKNKSNGYRALFCRPDLKFDSNGRPLVTKCRRRDFLTTFRHNRPLRGSTKS